MNELVYTLLIVVGVIIGLKMYCDEQARKAVVSTPKPQRKTRTRTRTRTRTKPRTDPNWKVAKATLVASGWTATDAKKMLEGITASTANEYVNKAMMKVKI